MNLYYIQTNTALYADDLYSCVISSINEQKLIDFISNYGFRNIKSEEDFNIEYLGIASSHLINQEIICSDCI